MVGQPSITLVELLLGILSTISLLITIFGAELSPLCKIIIELEIYGLKVSPTAY